MSKLLLKAVFPGKYIQGVDARYELPGILQSFGKTLIVAGSSALAKVISCVNEELPKGSRIEHFNGECCDEELGRLSAMTRAEPFFAVVGAGGGKAIDTAKIVADRAAIPAIILPTIASTDAPCSACAVVYTNQGVFQRVEYQRRNPEVVLVDTSVIAQAPARFLVTGMGDALATWFEARSCSTTASKNECGGLSTLSASALAEVCMRTLMRDGVAAKLSCERHEVTPELERIVEANTLLSGLGFESAGLAAAHAIHNGLTALKETHAYYHGEKVAFGLLAGLHLIGADRGEIEQVYEFCEAVELPTTLRDIGLKDISKDYLRCAAEHTCTPGSSIYHEAVPINAEGVLTALLAADALGTSRKASPRVSD